MSDAGDWVFGLTEDREWEWRHRNRATGADVERSSRTFGAFSDCMADARQHGYAAPAAMSAMFPQRPTAIRPMEL
jgi:hypothetical protein